MHIAILSRGKNIASTQRLLAAGQARGHNVTILDHAKCYCVIERNSHKVMLGDKDVSNFDAIIPRIGASVTFYGAAIVRQFELIGVFSTTSSIALVRSRDKLRSLQLLSKAGVDIPKTAFARAATDTDYIINQVGGSPLIVKLVEGTQGQGVVLAETKSAARSVIEAFYGLQANIIVQQFVSEAGGADIRAFVIGGEVVAAMHRQGKEGDFRSNLHRGGVAKNIALTECEKNAAIHAAEAVGLQIAGVDILQSKEGPKVVEVNSSPGLEGIEESTGVDIADLIIQYIEQHAKVAVKKRDSIGV